MFLKRLLIDGGPDRAAALEQNNGNATREQKELHKRSDNLPRNQDQSTWIFQIWNSGRAAHRGDDFSSFRQVRRAENQSFDSLVPRQRSDNLRHVSQGHLAVKEMVRLDQDRDAA